MKRIYTHLFLSFISICLSVLPMAAQTWNSVGPIAFPVDDVGQINGIGRVVQLKFDPVSVTKMYAVAAHGVFMSNDTATTWNILPGTSNFPVGIGCASVCINSFNTNTIYVGTGDANYYNSTTNASGVWKSVDGGNTFVQSTSGLGNKLVINMLMSPVDSNTLVAATNAGMYKTTNGGSSWTLTSPVDQITDMRMNAGAGSITIYAIARTTGNFYRSTDLGSTWTTLNIGPSTLGAGRLAVTPSDTTVVYLGFIGSNNTTGGVIYKSTDKGVTFTQKKADVAPNLVGYTSSTSGQGNYNFDIEADPGNANTLYLCAHLIWKSTDGGATWTQIQASWAYILHTDQHGLRFNPNNANQFFNVNDGGVWINRDHASTNSWLPKSQGLVSSEFYHMANSHGIKYLIGGGLQDNGEVYYKTNTWHCNRGGDWTSNYYFDNSNANNAYYVSGATRRDINNTPTGAQNALGVPGTVNNADLYAFSLQNGNAAFYAQNDLTNLIYGVYATSNLQTTPATWTSLSGFSPTTKMLAMSVSPADANTLYILSNNKSVVRSTNALGGSPTFTTVTAAPQPSGTPGNGGIAVLKSGVVYLSSDGYVFRSSDQGVTWTAIGSGPVTTTLNAQKIIKLIGDTAHAAHESIYAVTASAVYYKDNTIPDWAYYGTGMPTTAKISDMDIFYDASNINNSLLRVSTYGRGVWEIFLANSTPMVPPTVAITSPASGAVYSTGSNITLTATASSPNTGGSITKVDFYQGSTLLGTATTAPYTFTWNNVATGGYSITAVATDNNGLTTTSTAVNILVGTCTSPAVIAQSNMRVIYFDSQETISENGAATNVLDGNTSTIWHTQYNPTITPLPHEIQLSLGGTYMVNTFKYLPRQSGTNGMVAQYEIYVSTDSTNWGTPVTTGTLPGGATEKVITFTEKLGKYIRFRALSEINNQQYTSAAEMNVAGCVQTGNLPPVVSITAPANNANFTPGSNITINATASSQNSGGSISKVDFYQNSSLLGTSTVSPYSYAWNNVAAGSYSLTAVATDNLNLTATSSAVNITVSTPVCNAPTGLNASAITTNSATVSWTAVAGAASYNVDYKTSASGTWTNAATATTATSVNLSGLTVSTSYDWRVRTNCTTGDSSAYSQSSFTTASPAACPDVYEPNNTFATAKSIAIGTAITANIATGTEADWFSFKLSNTNSTNIKVTLSNLPADYDLYLYNSSNVQIGSSTNTGTVNETIVYNAGVRKATYYVKVVSKSGAADSTICYNLLVQTSSTPWPAIAPTPMALNAVDAQDVNEMQLFPNPASDKVTVQFNSDRSGHADISLFTPDGKRTMMQAVSVVEGVNSCSVDVTRFAQGLYLLQIQNGSKRMVKKLTIVR